VFIDESGLLMAPLVRRSWGPRGNTPLLYQRTRSHQKVSVIAALCVAPTRDRVRLYFRLHADANVNAHAVIDFLRVLLRQLPGPIVLIWDRLQAHRSKATGEFLARHERLHAHLLPPYAPELNPVENVWGYLKMNPLANYAPLDLEGLLQSTRHHGRSLQRKQDLIRSFMAHCPLSFRLL
jgi:transposase